MSKYGAVTAKPFPNVPASCDQCDLSKPFDRMQVVAFVLLRPPKKSNIFEPRPFRFEVLCIHITKASIAATLVIPEGKRPSIQVALEKIGFVFDDSVLGRTLLLTRTHGRS